MVGAERQGEPWPELRETPPSDVHKLYIRGICLAMRAGTPLPLRSDRSDDNAQLFELSISRPTLDLLGFAAHQKAKVQFTPHHTYNTEIQHPYLFFAFETTGPNGSRELFDDSFEDLEDRGTIEYISGYTVVAGQQSGYCATATIVTDRLIKARWRQLDRLVKAEAVMRGVELQL